MRVWGFSRLVDTLKEHEIYFVYKVRARTHTHTVTLNKTLIFFFPSVVFLWIKIILSSLLSTLPRFAELEAGGVGWIPGGGGGVDRVGCGGSGKGWVGMANGIMTGRATVAFLNGEAT